MTGKADGARIDHVAGPADIDAARALIIEYARALECIHTATLTHQGFEAEMASLPGQYAAPSGCLLLARERTTNAPLGCVAMRSLSEDACELKRLYVRPVARGRGIARSLCMELVRRARALGYSRMNLDTEEETMAPAVSLYRSIGFVNTPRYNDDPCGCTLYMTLDLSKPLGKAD
ncbi:MAG: GNAT family N-acetyltransferase [Phycisphaerae bacterium]|nr:GNAT family N-acetyltransferase [Phycisphaerae bacterium]